MKNKEELIKAVQVQVHAIMHFVNVTEPADFINWKNLSEDDLAALLELLKAIRKDH